MKAVAEKVRKYYKWTDYVSFARANITANNGFVATSNTGYITGYSFFQGNQLGTGNTDAPYPTFTLQIPSGKFRISSIYNHISSNGKGVNSWDIYKNGEKIERITFSQQGQTINLTNPIELLPQDVFSITAVGYASYGGTWTSFSTECNFENCELVEGTESDYDFYKDIYEYSLPTKTERKYYKYGITYTMPNMTSANTPNGTVALLSGSDYGTKQPWQMFNSEVTDDWVHPSSSTYSVRYTFDEPLIAGEGSISGYYSSDDPKGATESKRALTAYSITLNYSDGTTEVIKQWNGSTYAVTNITANYKAYKNIESVDFSFSGSVWYTFGTLYDFTMTHTPIIEGTESDYDFYKDLDTYKAIKSYEKGQYYGN